MQGHLPDSATGFLTQVGRVTEGLRLLTEQYGDLMHEQDLGDLRATLTVLESYLSGLADESSGRPKAS